ncbi:MAG: MBL fold metallo-hydrolase [Pseudomonadota bacterium]
MTQPTYHFIRNATARLTYGGKTFLLDPMLSDKGAFMSFAGIAPNPIVDLPVPAAQIVADIDAVIVSHLHDDHFDEAAAHLLDKTLTVITPHTGTPSDVSFKVRLEAKGFNDVREIGTPETNQTTWEGITLHKVFARHGKGSVGDAMGDVFGLVFEADGEPTIYWPGDTILDEAGEIEAVLKRFKPDVVIAHAGGPIIEAMSPEIILMDAAQTAMFFGYAQRENPHVQMIAIHMEALDHCFSSRADLVSALKAHDSDLQHRVIIPRDGERIALRTPHALAA